MRPFARPFIAFIRKQPDTGFRVSFPDLPECRSAGATIAEARDNAESALARYWERLHEVGAQIPSASYWHELTWRHARTDGLVVLIAPPHAA